MIQVAHNAGFYWPKNSLIKKPEQSKITIGIPIKSHGLKAEELNSRAQDWIERAMLKLNV